MSLAGDVAKDAMQHSAFLSDRSSRSVRSTRSRVVRSSKSTSASACGCLTRAGERSIAGFSRFVPVVGGVVGGALDAVVCRMVGRHGEKSAPRVRKVSRPSKGVVLPADRMCACRSTGDSGQAARGCVFAAIYRLAICGPVVSRRGRIERIPKSGNATHRFGPIGPAPDARCRKPFRFPNASGSVFT